MQVPNSILNDLLKERDQLRKAKPQMGTGKCPKCGESFRSDDHRIVKCHRCHEEGSTACCNPDGPGRLCSDCNQELDASL